jgi:small-conductance mechanosensitive channel
MPESFWGNSPQALTQAGSAFLMVLASAWLIKRLALRKLKYAAERTATQFDDFVVELLASVSLFEFAVIALHVSLRSLAVPAAAEKIVHMLLVLTLARRGVLILRELVSFGIAQGVESIGARDPSSASALKNLKFFLNIAIWLTALLLVLDNLGVNITTAVAGLGIGGLAVAMAAQTLLKDLFGSFVIFLDKPFRIGDYIVIGDVSGTVEHVGIKTTRLKSLSGEQLVIANSDLTSSRIRNYRHLRKRRVVREFSVDRSTPPHVLREIPKWVREMMANIESTEVDRVHLKDMSDVLTFELVYHIDSADYGLHMDVQQTLLQGLLELFREHGVALALPTQARVITNTE